MTPCGYYSRGRTTRGREESPSCVRLQRLCGDGVRPFTSWSRTAKALQDKKKNSPELHAANSDAFRERGIQMCTCDLPCSMPHGAYRDIASRHTRTPHRLSAVTEAHNLHGAATRSFICCLPFGSSIQRIYAALRKIYPAGPTGKVAPVFMFFNWTAPARVRGTALPILVE